MGCNAWNHPSGCKCGWGGDTGGGSGIWSLPLPDCGNPKLADGRTWATGCERVPNAKCPICEQAVYFVQTENGGRVFFDELGPPWPKHPCTDNSTARVFVPDATRSRPAEAAVPGWHLIQSPKIKLGEFRWNIDGYCPGLGIHLCLCGLDAWGSSPIPPVFVKAECDSGTYLCSFITQESISLSNPAVTKRFFPQIPNLSEWEWMGAFGQSRRGANSIGWRYSPFWDEESDGAKFQNHRVAEYWFRKAAEKGDASGENNYGLYRLRGYNGNPDPQEAWKYLLRAAFRMTPESYGHMGEMLVSGFLDFDPRQLGLLFKAVSRQLDFDDLPAQVTAPGEDDDDEEESTPRKMEVPPPKDPGCRYSPCAIGKYSYFETAANVAKLTDPLPGWNLVWLSVGGIDDPVQGGDVAQWHCGLTVPSGLLETMLFNLDHPLRENVTLRDALRMHPRRFLHYFESADTSSLSVEKRNFDWKGRVILQAKEAALRMPEAGGDGQAVVLPVDFAVRKK